MVLHGLQNACLHWALNMDTHKYSFRVVFSRRFQNLSKFESPKPVVTLAASEEFTTWAMNYK